MASVDDRKKTDDFRAPESQIGEGDKENDTLMVESRSPATASASGLSKSFSSIDNNGPLSVLAYCLSSISMTVVNKYVVSGDSWNLAFLYLAAQVRFCLTRRHDDGANIDWAIF